MTEAWQKSLAQGFSNFAQLLKAVALEHSVLDELALAHADFATRVPREFVARMQKGNPNDPLLLQVLPQAREVQQVPGFYADPLYEREQNPVPGLLHKYPSRVLLTLSGGCAINCRYCFRRHFPYQDNLPGQVNWQRAVKYIADHPEVDEVIFSGGDPLLLKDHQIAGLVATLESIAHLKRVRIHTRLPIVIPSRVTDAWVDWMMQTRLQTVVVLHTNHPNEIDQTVLDALKKLRASNTTLLNQSVLLKGVNDDADILAELSRRLFTVGVLPYYLHLLDKVQGAAHFDISIEKAHGIVAELKTKLPGFLVPKLAQEVAGELSKKY